MKERNLLHPRLFLSFFWTLSFCLIHQMSFAQVLISVESEAVDKGDVVELDVTTDDFTGIASIQWSHNFDSTILEFIEVVDINTSLSGLSSQGPGGTIENGEITVSWFDQSGGVTNLPNGSKLYTVRFNTIGNECDTSAVTISNTPRKIEILDNNLDELPFELSQGEAIINGTDCSTPPDVTFRLNEVQGPPSTEVCLQLRVDGFVDIENFQWSLKWDQSVATFSRVTNFNLSSLNAGKFNFDMANNALRCIWDDDMGLPITVPNATRIADICFNIVGNPGDMTDVFWSDTPLPLEVTRANVATPVPTTTQSGKITVTMPSSGEAVEMIVCDAQGNVGDNICMPVKVVNFIEISSFQFSMELPNGVTVASPNSINHALPGFNTSKIANPMAGVIRAIWDDIQGGCQTLPDSTVLFELCLTSDMEGMYPVSMSNTPLRAEMVNCDDDILDVDFVGPGILTVIDDGGMGVSVTLRDTLSVRCADRCRGFIDVMTRGGSGDYTIRWFEDGTALTQFNDMTQARDLCGGNYMIIVCDANNPTDCDTLMISLRKPALISVMETITPATSGCNGQVLLNVSGGTPNFNFRWSANASNQTTNPAIDLCKGRYNCTITDGENCTFVTDTFTVTGAPIQIGQPTITEPTCFGDCDGAISIPTSGGCGPLSYLWTVVSGMGVINQPTNQNQTGLCAGQYKVAVSDTSGAMAMTTITVNQPDAVTITLDSIRNGNPGFIYVTVSGGTSATGTYVCKWTDSQGNLVGQTETLGPVPPGTYIKMATDDNGCMAIDTFTLVINVMEVDVNTNITPGGTNVSCNGLCDGEADVVVSNGSGSYSYEWSHDNTLTGPSADDLCAGTYRVTVEDQVTSAIEIGDFVITEPDSLKVDIIEMSCASSIGSTDGAYRAVPNGGSSPYNFLWCNNSTSSVPTNLEGGSNCNVLVTDANNCQIFVDDIDICVDGGGVDSTCFEGRDVITPNGDGMNDNLIIGCVNDPRFADNELFIFNRRGQLINQYRGYNNQWSGTDENGNLITEDAYMWVFSVRLQNGVSEVYRGTVTVLLNR